MDCRDHGWILPIQNKRSRLNWLHLRYKEEDVLAGRLIAELNQVLADHVINTRVRRSGSNEVNVERMLLWMGGCTPVLQGIMDCRNGFCTPVFGFWRNKPHWMSTLPLGCMYIWVSVQRFIIGRYCWDAQVEPMLATMVSQSRINDFLCDGLYANHPNQYCTPIRSQVTKKALQNSTTKSALIKAVKSRYATLNLKSMSKIQTVEFRIHNGTTDALKVVRWLSLCQQVFHQAIRQRLSRDLRLYSRRRDWASYDLGQEWVKELPRTQRKLWRPFGACSEEATWGPRKIDVVQTWRQKP